MLTMSSSRRRPTACMAKSPVVIVFADQCPSAIESQVRLRSRLSSAVVLAVVECIRGSDGRRYGLRLRQSSGPTGPSPPVQVRRRGRATTDWRARSLRPPRLRSTVSVGGRMRRGQRASSRGEDLRPGSAQPGRRKTRANGVRTRDVRRRLRSAPRNAFTAIASKQPRPPRILASERRSRNNLQPPPRLLIHAPQSP
jgi:hypothetical protein